MALIFFDGVLRGGTMALLLLLAWNFAQGWRRSQTARLGLLLTISGLCYLFLPALPAAFNNTWWRVPAHLCGMAAPGLFWLFAASWFDDDFVVEGWHRLVITGLVLAGSTSAYLGFPGQWPRPVMALFWPIPSLIVVALGLGEALRGRDNDLVEARRRARLALVVTIAAMICVIVGAEVLQPGWPPPPEWRLVNATALLVLSLVVAVAVFGWRDAALLEPAARPGAAPDRPPAPEADDSLLLARLHASMTHGRTYRQDGLTITTVAAGLGVPEYRLRRAINQGLGARNFNAYLNGFRIGEAKAALADPAQREVPILTIALDAGFGSLAPFNRAFRADTGCTPSEFRAKSLGG